MAKVFPSYEIIKTLKVPPTTGELRLIDFLIDNLNDEYEIYFKPFLNGDCPDIVLMRKGGGVLIIVVKDWTLENFYLDAKKRWFLSHNNVLIKSPIQQVLHYKDNIYNLHIEKLLECKFRDYRYGNIVNCAVFFSCETKLDLRNFLLTPFEERKKSLKKINANKEAFENVEKSEDYYLKFINKNIELLGKDTLNKNDFHDLLNRKWISKYSSFFTENIYESFKRYLTPSFHSFEEGIDINFTRMQELYSESKEGVQKIKGLVGAGKTLVLAKRAVNAYKRTNEAVLILTFNISLKNYIHDKLNNVRDDFSWENFHIVNYHDYFNSTANNLGIQLAFPDDFDSYNNNQKDTFLNDNFYGNLELFECKKDAIKRYATILIDEVQDYTTNWLRIIRKYFLEENGEFVVFGDSKQDIYNRVGFVNNKKELTIPNSPGRWGELNKSLRLTPTITSFASSFQKAFLSVNHNLDEFEDINFQTTFFDNVHYKYFGKMEYENIADFIIKYSKKIISPPNDICVLALSIETIRELDYLFRQKSKEKTFIMAETKEFFNNLKRLHGNTKKFHDEIKKIRKNKKLHFLMNSGVTKFSTVHSYKGWEIKTLFLIVQKDILESTYRELIYTGFTRCMSHLVILNIDDMELHDFMDKSKLVDAE